MARLIVENITMDQAELIGEWLAHWQTAEMRQMFKRFDCEPVEIGRRAGIEWMDIDPGTSTITITAKG